MRARKITALLLVAALGAACSSPRSGDAPAAQESVTTPSSPSTSATPDPSTDASTGPSPSPSTSGSDGPVRPAQFDPDRALRHVQVLAGAIGPRLATGRSYEEAAEYVQHHVEGFGYAVRMQRFDVPAGDSWGVPVRAGDSANVIATPPGFDPDRPYLLVGAHLDTVAVAPGAEDNASGVAVLLELARLADAEGTRMPVVLVAFGAEEPRGEGDALHHFGSQHHVRNLAGVARRNLQAMVSLDRVGVGASVPVCTGGLGSLRVRDALLSQAERLAIPTVACADNRSSDHWSYEKAGFDVARLGSTPYAGYHSAGDTPDVVGPEQLGRTGRLIWAWLRAS